MSIEIRNQVRLSMAKCMELVLSGVKYRLFRAAITVTIIALAVTFLMTMLTESLVARRVAAAISSQVAPRENFSFWVGRISQPITQDRLTRELAELTPAGPRWKEIALWGSLGEAQMQQLCDVARRQVKYEDYFARLSPGQRQPLIGSAKGNDIFDRLQNPAHLAQFQGELPNVSDPLPGKPEEFNAFLADWKAQEAPRDTIIKTHDARFAALLKSQGNRTPAEVLAQGDESVLAAMAQQGFQITADELGSLKQFASLTLDADRLGRLVAIIRLKRRLAERIGAPVGETDAAKLFAAAQSESDAQWLVGQVGELRDRLADVLCDVARRELSDNKAELKKLVSPARKEKDAAGKEVKIPAKYEAAPKAIELLTTATHKKLQECGIKPADVPQLNERVAKVLAAEVAAEKPEAMKPEDSSLLAAKDQILQFNLTPQRIMQAASHQQAQANLNLVEAVVSQAAASGTTSSSSAFSSRTIWLLVVSFLVCIVGIANAMLMSVTERFREIATMKCLGATDGFIMVNFILESVMQGLAGSAAGMLLGLLLGSLRSVTAYGWVALQNFPVMDILTTAGLSVVVGVVVSALAAVYPASVAARLAPMEAMRIE